MAANKIYIQVDFQSQTAQGAIMDLNKNIASIGTSSQQATGQAAQGMKGLSVSIDQVSSSVSSFTQALLGLGLAQLAREMIGIGAELQRLKVGFDNVIGGAQAWEQLHTFAQAAGLDFQELIKNANELRNAGLAIPKVVEYIKAFADQTVHAGQSQEALNRVIGAAAKIAAAGYVNVKSLVEFRQIGLEPTKIVADKLNQSIQEMRKESAQLNSTAVLDLIVNFAKTQSEGEALRRGNELLSAQFGKVKDAFVDTSTTLTQALQPAIKAVVNELIELLKYVKLFFEFLQEHQEIAKFAAELLAIAAAIVLLDKAMQSLVAMMGLFTAAAAESAIGLGALETVLLSFGPAAVALGALIIEYKYFAAIREAVTHEERDQLEMETRDRKEAIFQLEQYEQRVAKLRGTKVSTDVSQLSTAQIQSVTKGFQTELEAAKKPPPGLLEPNYAELERQAKEGATILAEAQRKFYLAGHEAIKALDYEYAEHFKQVSKSAQGTADVAIAANYAIATVVKKRNEELNKENEKVLEETVSMARKIAIASETLYPDATFAARKQAQQAIAKDEEAAINERFRLREELVRKESVQLIQEAQTSKLFATEELRTRAIAKLKSDLDVAVTNLEMLGDQTVYEHKLKTLSEIHKLEEEERKQDRDEALEDQLDFLQKSADLRIKYAEAVKAQTLPEQLRQIETVRDLEIQAIQDTQQARLAAVEAEVEDYKSKHIIGVKEVEETAARQAVLINRDAQAQMQLDRLNAWKEGNDAVIEEQKRVYDSLRSAFDKVWSALTDRSKSVWANIGNALRTALTDAVKDFVTSRAAASLTEAITGRSVTFPGGVRGFGGNAAKFEGLGAPPAMQALVGPLAASGQGLGVAAVSLNTSAGSLVVAAQALVTAAGAIAAGVGGTAGTALAAVNSASGAVSSAAASIPSGGAMAASAGLSGGGGMLPGIILPTAAQMGGVGLPGFAPGMAGSLGIGGSATAARNLTNTLGSFGIGKSIQVVTGAGSVMTVPWATATTAQKLGAIAKSPGFMGLLAGGGTMLAMGGLQRGGVSGNIQTGIGGALAGIGVAGLFPALEMTYLGGALIGGGLGVMAAGLQRGGKVGLGMSIGGAALAGGAIGAILGPGGALIGAAIGAAVGGIAGLIRLLNPNLDQRIRSEVKRVYGVDISQKSIRDTIAQIVTSKYGGNLSIALYSQDVQDIVRLYALNVGQSQAGLPRPMYGASFAQSQVGGLQMQPVYSGGQLVQNPYQGTTTTQLQNALIQNNIPAMYLQLSPQQANDLFTGRVVQAIGANPGAVAQANTTAAVSGSSRTSQVSALIEPLAVTR